MPVDELFDPELERLQLHQTFKVRDRVDSFEAVFLDGLSTHFVRVRLAGEDANEDGAVQEHEKEQARGELVALELVQTVESQQRERRHYDALGEAEGFEQGGQDQLAAERSIHN